MQYLKADTVTEVLIGPVVAVGDGFTPVTSLTIAGADEAEIIKHGATTVTAITGTLAAITSADGYYALDLVTGDVDTEGRLTILINDDSLCLPVRHDFMVVNANVFDSLFAAATTDYLQIDAIQHIGTAYATPTTNGVPEVDVTHVAGTAQTARDIGASVLVGDKTGFALSATGLDAIASTATGVQNITDAIWDEAKADHTGATTFGDLATDLNTVAVDVAGLDGAAMRGTDSAALASVCTEARLAILSGALTESYAADGVAPTLTQALFQLLSALTEFSISGTIITCKKLDGITTSMTFTLDDGTNPTLRTRAT